MSTAKTPAKRGAERAGPGHPPVGQRFEKGKSGNPSGRPKAVVEVVELARANTAGAIEALVEIMGSKSAPPAARVAAANSILDRAWGRPAQALELTGANGGPMQVQPKFPLRQLSDADLLTIEAIVVRASVARGDSEGEGAALAS